MVVTLQNDGVIVTKINDGSWKCVIEGVSYIAPTEHQLLDMVRHTYPIIDHTLAEQRHHNFVFHPQKYPLK